MCGFHITFNLEGMEGVKGMKVIMVINLKEIVMKTHFSLLLTLALLSLCFQNVAQGQNRMKYKMVW